MILTLYAALSYLAYPFVWVLLRLRERQGKELKERLNERKGRYSLPRPQGKLIWVHGASVGECLSTLPLIEKLVQSGVQVVVTSGTVTSAQLMEKRLPKGAFHQFIPVDLPTYAAGCIKHFHPDAGLFIESDFWPNILRAAHKANVPLILLNGRISDRSFARWQKAIWFIRAMLSLFVLAFGQTQEDARRLAVLGAKNTVCVGNLKFAALPPPVKEQDLTAALESIGRRPVWVAGSTHDDEEVQAAQVHLQLKKTYPELLTIIVPRHPNRAQDIETKIKELGLSVHLRSRQEDMNSDVYIGDTIGEMGLFYQLSPLIFVGGSLVPFGGQNMLEPMKFGACTFVGPYAFNFKEIVARADQEKALILVKDKEDLAAKLDFYLKDVPARDKVSQRAVALATSETAVLERVYSHLYPWVHA